MPETDAGGVDFAEFVDGSLPGLLRFGYVLTGNAQEAEDLVQDALAKSLRRWRRIEADNPVAYTRRVMINTHLTRWRRWGARVRLGGVPEAATDDAGLRRGEDWDALRRALAQLPSRQRAVLVLRYLEDLESRSHRTGRPCTSVPATRLPRSVPPPTNPASRSASAPAVPARS